jgi:hypothetical protein
MEIPSDKYEPDETQPKPVTGVVQTMQGIARRLIVFFTLVEEDRLEAGIYVGGEGRDE